MIAVILIYVGASLECLRQKPEQYINILRPSKCFRLTPSIKVVKFINNFPTMVDDLKKDLKILQDATAEVTIVCIDG